MDKEQAKEIQRILVQHIGVVAEAEFVDKLKVIPIRFIGFEQAAAELAQLFEREHGRVLWEGQGEVEYDETTELYDITTDDAQITIAEYAPIDIQDGQRVKVKIEELPEKRPENAKAQDVDL